MASELGAEPATGRCCGELRLGGGVLEASLRGPADVLRQVVRDENAHAELGWKFLQWALSKAGPELRQLARSELRHAIDVALAASPSAADRATTGARPELGRHGICPAARVHDARRRALAQIVTPLARALFVEPKEAPTRSASDAVPLGA